MTRALEGRSRVRDAATRLSKGTAFACYVHKESFTKCLEETCGTMSLLGQPVDLRSAVDKSTAASDAEARRSRKEATASRRNLHLARLDGLPPHAHRHQARASVHIPRQKLPLCRHSAHSACKLGANRL